MKDPRTALRAFLLADAPIAAIVGERAFHNVMPQGETKPSIVFSKISDSGDHTMVEPSGLVRWRLQLNSWADDADVAVRLANLVRVRLDSASGDMGAGADEVTVQGIFFADGRDLWDADSKLHGVGADYFVWFEGR